MYYTVIEPYQASISFIRTKCVKLALQRTVATIAAVSLLYILGTDIKHVL